MHIRITASLASKKIAKTGIVINGLPAPVAPFKIPPIAKAQNKTNMELISKELYCKLMILKKIKQYFCKMKHQFEPHPNGTLKPSHINLIEILIRAHVMILKKTSSGIIFTIRIPAKTANEAGNIINNEILILSILI